MTDKEISSGFGWIILLFLFIVLLAPLLGYVLFLDSTEQSSKVELNIKDGYSGKEVSLASKGKYDIIVIETSDNEVVSPLTEGQRKSIERMGDYKIVGKIKKNNTMKREIIKKFTVS